ncbi:MAG: ABC transporter permease DevC [Gammaproteobacteria bacterium]|nr:ABC transporter permease DevC [Gammaproteobacteria bacterium]
MSISALERIRTRTPLGWRQLRHNPTRLAVALGGVAFANVLIFMQLGVMGALFESAAKPVRMFNADILLMSPLARSIGDAGTLPRRRLYQALGVDGVKAGAAVQLGNIGIRNDTGKLQANVLAFGVDPDFDTFVSREIKQQLPSIRTADTALLDRLTRSTLKPMVDALNGGTQPRAELAGRTVTMTGLFSLGASFQNDGTLIMSDQTYLRLFPRNTGSAVSMILLQVEPGGDVEAIAQRIRDQIGAGDMQVTTLEGYADYIKGFMRKNTPIGFVFTFGVVIGLIIGFAIVYQILSADVNDHLAEYATFKAMGYSHGYLLGVVFEEALLLAALGFIPGVVLSIGLYWIIGVGTELAVTMPLDRPPIVLALTFVMCALSGAVATRRLKAADPADVF